jgi:Spy/CpxP family protein refolding chaperone
MKKTGLRTPVAAALAAAFTISLLALPAAAQAPGREDRPWLGMRMTARDALDITAEQEKKLEEFRTARIEESRAFREQMMKARQELDGLMKDPQANEAKINAAIDRMSKMHADRLKASVKSRAAWQAIFTPEQLEKMKGYREAFMGRPGMMMGRGGMAMGMMGRPGMMGRGGMAMGPRGFRGPGRFMGPGMGRWHMRGPGMVPGRPFGWRRW